MKLTIDSLAVRTPMTNSDPAPKHAKAPRLRIEVNGLKGHIARFGAEAKKTCARVAG